MTTIRRFWFQPCAAHRATYCEHCRHLVTRRQKGSGTHDFQATLAAWAAHAATVTHPGCSGCEDGCLGCDRSEDALASW